MRKNRLIYSLRDTRNVVLFGTLLLLAACGGENKAPDTSAIKIEQKTYRFDTDLYALDTNDLGNGLRNLKEKYPAFLDYFLDTVMAYGINGNYSDTTNGVSQGLKPFLSYKDYRELEDAIRAAYPDTHDLDAQLLDGFKLVKYYLPNYPVPDITYLNMGLSNWPAFPVDSNTFCIGLDMFLGEDFPHYASVGMPDYMLSHTRKSYIPVAVFSAVYKGLFPFQAEGHSLLDLMMQRGKEYYFLKKVLPSVPDSTLFGYRQQQLDWCHANEALIYNFFIRQQLLYSKVLQNTMPYVTEGPYARGFENPANGATMSPGSVGSWLGYQVVLAYMKQHPEITLQQLLTKPLDASRLLDEARYKPR